MTPIGPYVIERRLATGGMAEVYVAHRQGPHGFSKKVALKRILPQFAADPDFVSMFVDEAKLAASLDHPNVVQVFDFGEDEGELFLAMELVDGTTVNKLLRSLNTRNEGAPLDIALFIAAHTARALAYAHRLTDKDGKALGFVHRDVSPANILLSTSGHVKLADFGIAKITEHNARTEDGHVRGKLGYMSPEQVLAKPIDGRSDVFTLTTVFAELLLGEPLFGIGEEIDILVRIRDRDLKVLNTTTRAIPNDVRRLIERGLARDPLDRPNAAEFADACDEIRRRRGLTHGADRLTRMLLTLDLIEPSFGLSVDAPSPSITSEIVATRDHGSDSLEIVPGPAYYVHRTDGSQVGPLSYPELVQLITSGEIHGDSLVQKDDNAAGAARLLPELTRFVTSPALQWRLDELDQADARGEIQAGNLVSIVFHTVRRRRTGVLHLWNGTRRKKIYFVEGRPEFIGSTDRKELLGEYLVEQSFCLRMEVEMALALLPRYNGRLGDALVGLGVMRPMELFRAITGQVRERFLEAFRWRRGQWAFVPDAVSHEETFPLGDTAYGLLRDAVAAAHSSELEAMLAGEWELPIELNPEPPVSAALFDMPDAWLRTLEQTRSRTTVGAILARRQGENDPEDVYRALVMGLGCSFIRSVASPLQLPLAPAITSAVRPARVTMAPPPRPGVASFPLDGTSRNRGDETVASRTQKKN